MKGQYLKWAISQYRELVRGVGTGWKVEDAFRGDHNSIAILVPYTCLARGDVLDRLHGVIVHRNDGARIHRHHGADQSLGRSLVIEESLGTGTGPTRLTWRSIDRVDDVECQGSHRIVRHACARPSRKVPLR